jgi:hypothetical protein
MNEKVHNEGIIVNGGRFKAQQVSVGRNARASQKVGQTTDERTPPGELVSIAPGLYRQLESILLRCGPFDRERALRAVFIDARLSPWRDGLPRANNTVRQVRATIDYLYRRRNEAQENALVLFLRVLADQISPGDACRQSLIRLADDVEQPG